MHVSLVAHSSCVCGGIGYNVTCEHSSGACGGMRVQCACNIVAVNMTCVSPVEPSACFIAVYTFNTALWCNNLWLLRSNESNTFPMGTDFDVIKEPR